MKTQHATLSLLLASAVAAVGTGCNFPHAACEMGREVRSDAFQKAIDEVAALSDDDAGIAKLEESCEANERGRFGLGLYMIAMSQASKAGASMIKLYAAKENPIAPDAHDSFNRQRDLLDEFKKPAKDDDQAVKYEVPANQWPQYKALIEKRLPVYLLHQSLNETSNRALAMCDAAQAYNLKKDASVGKKIAQDRKAWLEGMRSLRAKYMQDDQVKGAHAASCLSYGEIGSQPDTKNPSVHVTSLDAVEKFQEAVESGRLEGPKSDGARN